MSWLAVAIAIFLYAGATFLVLRKIDQEEQIRYRRYAGANFYNLENWGRSLFFPPQGHITEGLIRLFFLPLIIICDAYIDLKFIAANYKYYLINGKEKRIKYVKNFVQDKIQKLWEAQLEEIRLMSESPQEFSPSKDYWLWAGRKKVWNILDVREKDLYEEFAKDVLISPVRFWVRFWLVSTTLILWPLSAIFGFFISAALIIGILLLWAAGTILGR